MGKLIHETAGRVERRLLLLLLLFFEAARRNWSASKTVVEAIGFRGKVVAGLEQALVSDAVRRLLLFFVGERKIGCGGEFSIENAAAVRVLMELLFRCINVVGRTDAAGGAVVVADVARTLELVQAHQLPHQADVFVVEIIVQAVAGRARHHRVVVEPWNEHVSGWVVVEQSGRQDGWVGVLLFFDFLDFGRTTQPRAISVPRTPWPPHLAFAERWRRGRRCFHQLVPVLFAH